MAVIADVRAALATALTAIPDLHVHAYAPGQVTPPAAVILPEQVTYDTSMDRDTDDLTLLVLLLVSAALTDTAQAQLDAYLDGSGTRSVKQAVEADPTLGGVVHWTRVVEARNYGLHDYHGVELFGCEVVVQVGARGSG